MISRRLPNSRAMGSTSGRGGDEYVPPCAARPDVYDTLLDFTCGPQYNRALRTARDICAGCEIRERCLRENRHEPGVIAGLTYEQRKHLKVRAK